MSAEGDHTPHIIGETTQVLRLWESNGLRCLVVYHHGHHNGYVMVPEGHPWHGLGMIELWHQFDIEVHGGVTWSAETCWSSDSFGTCGWWVGFDTNHLYDMQDPEWVAAHPDAFAFPPEPGEHYWTQAETEAQTELLAAQAAVARVPA